MERHERWQEDRGVEQGKQVSVHAHTFISILLRSSSFFSVHAEPPC